MSVTEPPDEASPNSVTEQRRADLIAAAERIVANPDGVSHDRLMLALATLRAARGWPVLPLRGKAPAIKARHEAAHPCKGECGEDGHGVWDGTTDITTVSRWWGGKYRGYNIGMRVIDALMVIDLDPRKEGHATLIDALQAEHGPFPHTLTTLSGRRDGGRHLFYLRPAGVVLNAKPFGDDGGIDVLGTGRQAVAPGSIHPDTKWRYLEVDAPIIAAPQWVLDFAVKKPQTAAAGFFEGSGVGSRPSYSGTSIADWVRDNYTWAEILLPHGWSYRGRDGEGDGSVWLHPAATSQCSATITHGQLFVWSTSTPFEPSAPGDPHGYTKFKAYAMLNHGGETSAHMSAAAQSLRTLEGVA